MYVLYTFTLLLVLITIEICTHNSYTIACPIYLQSVIIMKTLKNVHYYLQWRQQVVPIHRKGFN